MPEPLTVQIARLEMDGAKLVGAIEKRGSLSPHTAQCQWKLWMCAKGRQMGRKRGVVRSPEDTASSRAVCLAKPRNRELRMVLGTGWEHEAGERSDSIP